MIETRIETLDPRTLRLLEVNARYMPHETFMRLVENIKRDGCLTQLPFAWRLHDDGTREPVTDAEGRPVFEVLSGNHRVQAAIAAGLAKIDVQVTDGYLTPDQRKAIQLSHNALTGEDDPAILKTIFDSIADPAYRVASGLDDATLKLLDDVQPAALSEANLAFQPISLIFLPDEIKEVLAVWEQVLAQVKGKKKGAWLARWAEYDATLDAIELACQSHGVKNVATGLMIVLQVFMRHLDDLQEGWLDGDGEPKRGTQDVPIATVYGPFIPSKTAAALRRLTEKMVSRGDVPANERWRALDLLVSKYQDK